MHQEANMEPKSEDMVRDEVAQRLREIEVLERRAREEGLAFASRSEEELAKKVRGQATGSPYIYGYQWTFKGAPGSLVSFTAHVSNPDPDGHNFVFVSVSFGVANHLDLEAYGKAVAHGNFYGDSQWPYLTSAPFNIAPGATHSEPFQYTIPAGAPLTTHPANVLLWGNESLFGQGSFYDRCLFYVTVA
jgi:hypothetical protein